MKGFKGNMMIANPDKFQAIFIDRKKQQNNPISIKINDININFKNIVGFMGFVGYPGIRSG